MNVGIAFCTYIIEGFADKTFTILKNDWNNDNKSSFFNDTMHLNNLDQIGIKITNIGKSATDIKTSLQKIISNMDEVTLDKISDLQNKIHFLSLIFHTADINNLRHLKEKRSLKAYG